MAQLFSGIVEPTTIFSVEVPPSTKVIIFNPISLVGAAPQNTEVPLGVNEGLEIAANITLEANQLGVTYKKSHQLEEFNVVDTNSFLIIPGELVGFANNNMATNPNSIKLKLNLLLTRRVKMQIFNI